jgi:hypothetical protein
MRRHIAKHRKSFQLLNVEDGRGRTLYVLAWRREVMQMDIDAKIVRVKELIAKREELDAELQELLGGTVRERRSPKCSICGERGHRASTCPSKQTEATQ